MVEISPDLACFCRIWSDFFVAPVGSGCSGFGDANPSLDPPVSVFENGNPLPTDWTFGSGRNRVVGLRSGLDSPNFGGILAILLISMVFLSKFPTLKKIYVTCENYQNIQKSLNIPKPLE